MSTTLDDIIEELSVIIDRSIEANTSTGYFPALYRRVTIEVRNAIRNGTFHDNDRMERLDIVFAQRYLDAYHTYQNKQAPTHSWKAAFDNASNPKLTTLQHLLLGMNAHISLDLGIAAASVSDRTAPLSLKADFYAINHLLASLIDDTQERLTRIFRPLHLTDRLLGSIDENLSIFSIGYARDKAWTQTLELLLSPEPNHLGLISERDLAVANFAKCLVTPKGFWPRLILRFVRLFERGTPASKTHILAADSYSDR